MPGRRTALFVTCLVDQLFPRVAEASVRLLERAGCRVEVPGGQTCCGQPALNLGYREEALLPARRWLDVFDGFDTVVSPSGSCVSMVRRSFPELLSGEPDLAARARDLASRTFELTELLAAVGFDPSGSAFRGRVTVHDSCHLLRELGITEAPRDLLRRVPGLELVEMDDADVCCGFGGAFAVKEPDLSGAMLGAKLDAAERTGAEVVTATDCGCLMHLGGAVRRRGGRLRVLHVAEILAPE